MNDTLRIMAAPLVLATFLAGCDSTTVLSPSRKSAQQDFSKVFRVTTQTSFSLTGINGNIEIFGRPGTNTVTISGTRTVESDTQEDADSRLDDLIVETDSTAAGFLAVTIQPKDTGDRNYTVDYVVSVPGDFTVDVVNVNGNVTVLGPLIRSTVRNTNGNVLFNEIEGTMIVRLVNGNISGTSDVPPGSDVDLTTTNGNLDLGVPESVSATVSASLANGRISVVGLTLLDREETSRSLNGRLGDGAGDIRMVTVNGNITLFRQGTS